MEEIWKAIEGFEGLYEVSNIGNVRTLNYKRTKNVSNLKQKTQDNRKRVILCKNGVPKTYLVHRLVANAFIPNPEKKPCIDHIDGNPSNNNVENLRWCTQQENCSFPLAIKHKCEAMKGNNLGKHHSEETKKKIGYAKSKQVYQYTLDNVLVNIWCSAKEASVKLKLSQSAITNCCRGESSTSNGYIWKYKPN